MLLEEFIKRPVLLVLEGMTLLCHPSRQYIFTHKIPYKLGSHTNHGNTWSHGQITTGCRGDSFKELRHFLRNISKRCIYAIMDSQNNNAGGSI